MPEDNTQPTETAEVEYERFIEVCETCGLPVNGPPLAETCDDEAHADDLTRFESVVPATALQELEASQEARAVVEEFWEKANASLKQWRARAESAEANATALREALEEMVRQF